MSEQIEEIGTMTEIDLENLRVLFHKSGNPAEQALFFQKLMSLGKTQQEIAKSLKVNQAHISRSLKLLDLGPVLFARVRSGEIGARTGYQLARLPKKEQSKYVGKKRVTMKDAEGAVRRYVLSEDVVNVLSEEEDAETLREARRVQFVTFVDRLDEEDLRLLRDLIDTRIQDVKKVD